MCSIERGSARRAPGRLLAAALAAFACGIVAANAEGCCQAGDVACLAQNEYDGKRVALVVGVKQYGGSGSVTQLADLKNTLKDAEDMAAILRQGYRVRCVFDPNRRQFFDEIDKLAKHLQQLAKTPGGLSDNSVVVHFSGHGFRVNERDFIFLSGNFTSRDQAIRSGAIEVFRIVSMLRDLPEVNTFLVLDACRNFANMQPNLAAKPQLPDWVEAAFGTPHNYERGKFLSIVYSTQAGSFAYDRNDDAGARDNGVFVHSLKSYFKLHGLDLEHIYRIAGMDVAMRKAKQHPDFALMRSPAHRPWIGKANRCLRSEFFAAIESAECAASADVGACFRDNACVVVNELDEAPCTRGPLVGAFPQVNASCPVLAGVPVAQRLGITRVAASAATSVAELNREAILISAVRNAPRSLRTDLPLPADLPAPDPVAAKVKSLERVAGGRRTVPPDVFLPMRQEILEAGRAPARAPAARPRRSSLQAPSGTIELYNLPGTAAGTTGRLKPTGVAKVDCRANYCSPDWVMVRVPTGRRSVDGWVRSDTVMPKPPVASAEVRFKDAEYAPEPASVEDLRKFAATANTNQARVVRLVAVIPTATADDEARSLSLARVLQVKNMLVTHAVGPTRIAYRIIEAENTAGAAPVTAMLLDP